MSSKRDLFLNLLKKRGGSAEGFEISDDPFSIKRKARKLNTDIPEEIVADAVKNIKKTYPLDDDSAREVLVSIACDDSRFTARLRDGHEGFTKWKEYKNLLKRVKKKIYYGGRKYEDVPKPLKEALLDLFLEVPEDDVVRALLSLHKSTEERISDYDLFFEDIFAATGKPESILDVGGGFNAFALSLIEKASPKLKRYVWTDIKDVELVKRFLDAKGQESHRIDLLEDLDMTFEDIDICFMFKLIPVLERRKRGTGKRVLEWAIKKIAPKWIVVSVSKISLVKEEDIEKREMSLITKILDELDLKIEKRIKFDKEIVCLVKI